MYSLAFDDLISNHFEIQSKLPKRQRRPCPTRPEYFDKVVSGELKGAALQEALINYNDQVRILIFVRCIL